MTDFPVIAITLMQCCAVSYGHQQVLIYLPHNKARVRTTLPPETIYRISGGLVIHIRGKHTDTP